MIRVVHTKSLISLPIPISKFKDELFQRKSPDGINIVKKGYNLLVAKQDHHNSKNTY